MIFENPNVRISEYLIIGDRPLKAISVILGQRGTLVIPASIRERLSLSEGSLLLLEETKEGLLIRPAKAMPVEIYTDERRAEFLLNAAVDAQDYARARKLVKNMGLDPDQIPHERPD